MKRAIIAAGIAASAVLVPIGVVSAAGSSTNYELTSAGGSAIFTDCTAATPVGGHCTGWVVSVAKNKGTDGKSSPVTVTVYDVEIADGGGFTPIYVGSGSAEGTVSVDSRLRKASAKATVNVLADCRPDAGICAEIPLTVSVDWVGTGAITKHSETSDDDNGTCRMSRSYKSTSRTATATGKINGMGYEATSIVSAPQIYSSKEDFRTNGCDVVGPFESRTAAETAAPEFTLG